MKNNTTSGGIGFIGLLQVAFIVLKLIGLKYTITHQTVIVIFLLTLMQ